MAGDGDLLRHLFIKLGGSEAPPDLRQNLTEVVVENSLHVPDIATMELYDPRLRWIDDPLLVPGTRLQVLGRPADAEPLIFDGEIVELEPHFSVETQLVIIRALDRRHRLARGRHVRSFLNVSDGDLVELLAQEVNLKAEVAVRGPVHPYVLQNNETNLTFLRTRAATLGNVLTIRGETLHCEPFPSGDGPVTLEWGRDLHEFRPRLTTLDQVDGVVVRGWDPGDKREIVGRAQTSQAAPKVGEARTGAELAHAAFGIEATRLVTNRAVRTQLEADNLARAEFDRLAGRYIQAEGTCRGNGVLVAGTAVRLESVGTRFSGTYVVTSAVHIYSAREPYVTQFTVAAQDPTTLLGLLDAGQAQPLMTGLVIGLVTDNQDPDRLGRVKVKYPSLSADHASDWARVATHGGGAQRGIEFLPEVDDEVVVGFELGDVHYPYILGGLWNGHDAPPRGSDQVVSGGHVQQRVIRSRSGHVIILDDADGGGGITLEDRNGNRVALDCGSNALTIQVQGDATIKADGNLTLEALGQVQIKGKGMTVDAQDGNLEMKGTSIDLN